MKKLWFSFIKELLLASRSYYFYIEVVFAFIFLFLLLFVIPENFVNKNSEYIHVNLPEPAREYFMDLTTDEDLDGIGESVELKSGGEVYQATLYETEDAKLYYFENEETVIRLAENEKKFGAIVELDDNNQIHYRYYLQGYESQRLKNMYLIFHNTTSMEVLKDRFDNQEVRPLYDNYEGLTDRENMIPSFLTFNGSLMGLFIIAAYIFLDKKEGVIKAYAVTASSVWVYLMSKTGILLLTSTVTSLIIVIPVMGAQPNYFLLMVFLLTTGFFASTLGLYLSSFYKDLMAAMGALYLFVILMLLPNIAYFVPSWDPFWMVFLPSYPMLEGFKEIILPNGDAGYVLLASAGFLIVGIVLFVLSNFRYKKTLSV